MPETRNDYGKWSKQKEVVGRELGKVEQELGEMENASDSVRHALALQKQLLNLREQLYDCGRMCEWFGGADRT
jgi:hypothetical protein